MYIRSVRGLVAFATFVIAAPIAEEIGAGLCAHMANNAVVFLSG